MDAHEFLKEYGHEAAESVAVKAGSNLAYFRQLACKARRPSVVLAQRLVAASEGRLDFMSLVLAKKPPLVRALDHSTRT